VFVGLGWGRRPTANDPPSEKGPQQRAGRQQEQSERRRTGLRDGVEPAGAPADEPKRKYQSDNEIPLDYSGSNELSLHLLPRLSVERAGQELTPSLPLNAITRGFDPTGTGHHGVALVNQPAPILTDQLRYWSLIALERRPTSIPPEPDGCPSPLRSGVCPGFGGTRSLGARHGGSRSQPVRVLMFGWEFPPHQAGGLATATVGLVKGLLRVGTEVTLVVPFPVESNPIAGLRLVGAPELEERLTVHRVPSPLLPYAGEAQYREVFASLKRPRTGTRLVYGPDLFREVERFASVAAEIAAREPHDLIDCHDWITFEAARRARAVSGRPIVAHIHAIEFDRTGGDGNAEIVQRERAGLLAADRVVANSHLRVDPVALYPGNYRVLIDNSRVRVMDFKLRRGDREVLHDHPAHVLYVLEPFTIRFTFPDGRVGVREAKPGEVLFSEAVTHSPINVGETDAHGILIELKGERAEVAADLITAFTFITGKEGREDELKRELLALTAPTRAEPGALAYDLYQSAGAPNRFVRFEVWRDSAALEAHKRTPHLKASFTKRQEQGWLTDITLWKRVEP